jgi:hypothetical protein
MQFKINFSSRPRAMLALTPFFSSDYQFINIIFISIDFGNELFKK